MEILPRGELLVITSKFLFIYLTDFVKSLQILVNASNPQKSPFFAPKGHPIVCWVVWIILQLQCTTIENTRVNTINTINTIGTIDRINYNNQCKENWYNQSDLLTMQTSPTQWHHCCFLFRFELLIKVMSIFVLHSSVIMLVLSPLLHILLMFSIRSYSGPPRRGETALPTRNGLLLCISRSAVSSWFFSTNITLFLC